MRENTLASNVSGRRPRHPSGGVIAVNSSYPKVPVLPAREEPAKSGVIPRGDTNRVELCGRLAGRSGRSGGLRRCESEQVARPIERDGPDARTQASAVEVVEIDMDPAPKA